MKSRPMAQWLTFTLAGVIALASLASYFLLDHLLGTIAESQIDLRANALMDTMLAVRKYTIEETTPIIEPINMKSDGKFLPGSVPSYAAMGVFKNMKRSNSYRDYRYREPVENPTNPEDTPSELEAAIIGRFQANPSLTTLSGDSFNPIRPYHYTARPLRVTSPTCLRCHSTAAAAPASLIKTYGEKNGFGWKEGSIIGAQVVRVPITEVIQSKEGLKRQLLFWMLALLAVLAAAMLLALQRLVVRPLLAFSSDAESASQAPAAVTFERGSRVEELNRLRQSLEKLRVSLLVAMNLANRP